MAAGLKRKRCSCSCLRHGQVPSVVSSEWASQGTGACLKTPFLLEHQVSYGDFGIYQEISPKIRARLFWTDIKALLLKDFTISSMQQEAPGPACKWACIHQCLLLSCKGELIRCAPVTEQECPCDRLLPVRFLIDLYRPRFW